MKEMIGKMQNKKVDTKTPRKQIVMAEVDYLLLHLFDAYEDKNQKEIDKLEARLEELRKELAEWTEQ